MVNHSSIKYISNLLDNPGALTAGDYNSIALFRQTFPYFVPVRYLAAFENNKRARLSDKVLSEIQPYLGNWILFCDFLNTTDIKTKSGVSEIIEPQQSVIDTILADETKVVDNTVIEELSVPIVTNEVVIEETIVIDVAPVNEEVTDIVDSEPLILPVYTEDYFLQQGVKISEDIPEEIDDLIEKVDSDEEDKSLMVMMSFSEWLVHFKNTSEKQQEEKDDQKALKTMWQKEKLAAALEEENEEIPEDVFEMAVNSITREDGLASESLAEIYTKQGKYDQAIEMYRKLSLRNPQKSTYFARKIDEVLKEK